MKACSWASKTVDRECPRAGAGPRQPIRAMCLLHLLESRIRPASAPRFSVEEIRDYYWSSDPERFK